MSDTYEDIITLPHHRSRTRTPMRPLMRAAQFASFAALSGYGDMVEETGRLTDRRPVLDDESASILNDRLNLLGVHLAERPYIRLRYFVPDAYKEGGAVADYAGRARRIDRIERRVIFTDGTVIPIDDLLTLEGELFRVGVGSCSLGNQENNKKAEV